MPPSLDRPSVTAAIADYLLQVNHRGYRPDRRKVLAVRRSDRTAWLRNAAAPVRWEVYYYVEGEIFAEEGSTRLPDGVDHRAHAETLVEGIWETLRVWNGFDFTPSSHGFGRGLYSDEPGGAPP